MHKRQQVLRRMDVRFAAPTTSRHAQSLQQSSRHTITIDGAEVKFLSSIPLMHQRRHPRGSATIIHEYRNTHGSITVHALRAL